MFDSWRTTVAGTIVALIGLILILTGKQVETGVALIVAGTGLVLARDQLTHDRDRKEGKT